MHSSATGRALSSGGKMGSAVPGRGPRAFPSCATPPPITNTSLVVAGLPPAALLLPQSQGRPLLGQICRDQRGKSVRSRGAGLQGAKRHMCGEQRERK